MNACAHCRYFSPASPASPDREHYCRHPKMMGWIEEPIYGRRDVMIPVSRARGKDGECGPYGFLYEPTWWRTLWIGIQVFIGRRQL